MAKDEPLTKNEKWFAAIACLAVLFTCCGLPSGCYMVLNTSLIGDWMSANHAREQAERKARLDKALTSIVEDESFSDEDTVTRLARAIFGEDDTIFYSLDYIDVTREPGGPLTARVTVLQDIDFELSRYGAERQAELLTEGMPQATTNDVAERTALLGLFGKQRGLASIEVLIRSRVTVGTREEDMDAFEFSIPPENLEALVQKYASRRSEGRFGYLNNDELDQFWIVHQDNFDEIVITVERN
mgnify:CR=1 FL=1